MPDANPHWEVSSSPRAPLVPSVRASVRAGCVTTNGFTNILYWVLLRFKETLRCTLFSLRVGIVAPASRVPSNKKRNCLLPAPLTGLAVKIMSGGL